MECGQTKKVFDKECNDESPCYCYEKFCIKGDYCNAGIAFWQGKPICGQNWGRKQRIPFPPVPMDDDLFCKELGYRNMMYDTVGYWGR